MKYRKLLCVAMVLILILGLSGSGFALTLDKISTNPIGTVTGVVEEKVYSKATLEDKFADNRVLVVLNNAASLKLKNYTAADFPEIQCASVSDLSTATKARVSAKLKGEDVAAACGAKSDSVVFSDFYEVDVQKYNQILCLTLPTAGKQNVLAAMKLLMQREDVMYAGPDYAMELFRTPNDDKYPRQQLHYNKISLPQAWDIDVGSTSVYVGVIDSGIDGNHDDLENRIDVNKSRDFSQGGCATVTAVTDYNGHGTHVAGIIGAQGNDGIGLSGVAWNVTLVSLRVLPTNDEAYSSYVAAAINYATEQSIPILNCSMGWTIDVEDYYDVVLETVIDNYPGLFVCAAGNNGMNTTYYSVYPANIRLPNLISVAATTLNDERRSDSNYSNTKIDIFAPGTDVWTTGLNNSHTFGSYTSIATPFVTGVAALMLSECPYVSAEDIKTKIMNNDDNISALSNLCVSGGRLNAYKALRNAHTLIIFGADYACTECGYVTHDWPS